MRVAREDQGLEHGTLRRERSQQHGAVVEHVVHAD